MMEEASELISDALPRSRRIVHILSLAIFAFFLAFIPSYNRDNGDSHLTKTVYFVNASGMYNTQEPSISFKAHWVLWVVAFGPFVQNLIYVIWPDLALHLGASIDYLRWADYIVTAPLAFGLAAFFDGVTDVYAVSAVMALIFVCIMSGPAYEYHRSMNQSVIPDLLFGFVPLIFALAITSASYSNYWGIAPDVASGFYAITTIAYPLFGLPNIISPLLKERPPYHVYNTTHDVSSLITKILLFMVYLITSKIFANALSG